jgi:FkbM family methyltransferase
MKGIKRLKYRRLIQNYKDKNNISQVENKLSEINSKTCNYKKFKKCIKLKNKLNEELEEKYQQEIFRKYKWYSYINKKKEESKIILIEANELLIPSLKENYKDLEKIHHIEYLNIAITPFDDCEYIDLYYNPEQDTLSSLINRNTHRFLNTVKVISKTVNKILEEKNIEYVDELHMDLEGLDYEILLSLDLGKYHFSLINYFYVFINF